MVAAIANDYGGINCCISFKEEAASEAVLPKTMDACDQALALDTEKTKVLDFLENRMGSSAANLSATDGHAVAPKLTGAAGFI